MKKKNKSFWKSPQGLAALVFISFPTYFLLVEHRGHIFQLLPYLILLLCLILHMFMHRGHANHSTENSTSNDSFSKQSTKNEAYRDGYIDGLKAGREEQNSKEKNNAQ